MINQSGIKLKAGFKNNNLNSIIISTILIMGFLTFMYFLFSYVKSIISIIVYVLIFFCD